MLASRLWNSFVQYAVTVQQVTDGGRETVEGLQSADFAFSEQWQVLGPFQIGTREAIWGADPLEYHGGFRALEYNETATFKSSLAPNGTVAWSQTKTKSSNQDPGHITVELNIGFPDIDWRFLQDVYGWAALQWQGWARSEIYVASHEVKTLALYSERILEFWIDGEHHFGGDFYGYARVPVTLHLAPGVHRIDVRLVRDVRAMGGIGDPTVNVKLRLAPSDCFLRPVQLRAGDPYGEVLVSDLADGNLGPLASPYGSVMLRNDDAQRIAYVYGVRANRNSYKAELVAHDVIKILPGQTKPVGFKLTFVAPTHYDSDFGLEIEHIFGSEDIPRVTAVATKPLPRNLHEPQKVTFMHPAGVVSYAVLRAPSLNAHCAPNASAPVLLQLHGAGLEADSDQVRHALDPVPDLCAWVLFPTGGSPWSGDDWHQWGFADVEAAVNAIPHWIEQVGWKGPGVDVNRWLVSGHSNGGQGSWYALTHRPDKIIAAAPVSGYSSIQNYVPYTFWHPADAGKTAIVQSALNSYRHELLLENIKGIPILQQHGGNDDNVPTYHSRLLSQLIQESGAESMYVEEPGRPHWYDGIMTSEPLVNFYSRHLDKQSAADVPLQLRDFTVVSANHGDMGSKNGVEILQLTVPGQLGQIRVSFDRIRLACVLETSNVARLHLPPIFSECIFITVDGQAISTFLIDKPVVWEKENNFWKNVNSALPPLPLRRGRQLGPIDAILRSHGAFNIVHHSDGAKKIALQISRNLCQYYGADTHITGNYDVAQQLTDSNIVSVAIGSDLPNEIPGTFQSPIQVFKDRIQVIDIDGRLRTYDARNGLAAIFLRSVLAEGLELVVWGADEESLEIAARLVPMLPGTGQPDFVIADRSMLWKGVEGTLALGYFDMRWKVSRNSYFT